MSNISYLPNSKNWNPVVGCQKISPACKYCWSSEMFHRFHPKEKFSDINLLWNKINEPYKWNKSLVATCFTSDLFQDAVPDHFLYEVFNTISCSEHTYVLLTKRSNRLLRLPKEWLLPLRDIWIGTTIENGDYTERAHSLLALKNFFWPMLSHNFKIWLSLEPLLGPINPEICKDFDWVVVGGESGAQARYMKPEWVHPIRDYCLLNNIPFYFKQWGKQKKGYVIDGKEHRSIPFVTSKEIEKPKQEFLF